MNFQKSISVGIALLAVSALSIARTQEKDIVDTAVGAGKFTTLVKLVTDAGLADTLKGPGPFTVLAPTDEAFAKHIKGHEEMAHKVMADKELLKKVLLHHVLKGTVMAADLKDGAKIETMAGDTIKVHIRDGKVYFGKAMVVMADVKASNGVIHAINEVLVPKMVVKTTTVTTTATSTGGGK